MQSQYLAKSTDTLQVTGKFYHKYLYRVHLDTNSTLVGIYTDCVGQDDKDAPDWKLIMGAFLDIGINGLCNVYTTDYEKKKQDTKPKCSSKPCND